MALRSTPAQMSLLPQDDLLRDLTPSPFGVTAVGLGYVSDADLGQALQEQSRRKTLAGRSSPIGLLLREMGLMTREQVTQVLRHLAGQCLPLTADSIGLAARLKVLHARADNLVAFTGSLAADAAGTALALALALAVMEQGRVLLIDANLRAPSLHQAFRLPPFPGLMPVDESTFPVPLSTALATLDILPAGEREGDYLTALMSPAAARCVEHFRRDYRYVLINVGEVLRHPEAAVMASRCDGVVAVLRAGRSSLAEVDDIERICQGLKVPLSGLILNNTRSREESA